MIRHPKMTEFDDKLKDLFDEIDDYLEDNYGELFPLHPARVKRGGTSSKSHDGLFSVTSSYTAGIGSEKGKGYTVAIRFVTLKKVDKVLKNKVEDEVMQIINNKLKKIFPDRKLHVARDGRVIKIYGDLSLGTL